MTLLVTRERERERVPDVEQNGKNSKVEHYKNSFHDSNFHLVHVKGLVYSKIKILLSFTHLYIVTNMHFLYMCMTEDILKNVCIHFIDVMFFILYIICYTSSPKPTLITFLFCII